MSAGTHKPAEALHKLEDHSDGWIQEGPLLYRLTDERRPKNRDEINVTMADGSRTEEARTRRAGQLLDAIRAAAPKECCRSHPHEEMTPMCELRTEIARLTNALARAEAQLAAAPQAVQADNLKEPKNGDNWRVVWWNESCRMLLPADKALDSFQSYKNGTLQFTLKQRLPAAKD